MYFFFTHLQILLKTQMQFPSEWLKSTSSRKAIMAAQGKCPHKSVKHKSPFSPTTAIIAAVIYWFSNNDRGISQSLPLLVSFCFNPKGKLWRETSYPSHSPTARRKANLTFLDPFQTQSKVLGTLSPPTRYEKDK